MGGRRLGKGLSSSSGRKFKLTNNVKYIDISKSSLNHRYYLHKDLKKKDGFYVKKFFNQVLNGNSAILNGENGVKEIKRERIYILERG